MNPQTVEQWAEYISALRGERLWAKAVAANTLTFVLALQEEGLSGQEIVNIFLLFALQFRADEQALPINMPDQYLSYPDLLASAGR
tara:strand:- start:1122 stop:1379 length:258 start_codon:yes stop_codon:yes gene_type:complete